jgi:predicted amidohydrolase
LVSAVGIPAASASAGPVWQTIKVKAVQVTNTQHGTSDSFTEKLIQNGRVVGHDAVTCKFNFATQVAHCTGVAIFPGSGDLFVTATSTATQNGATGRVVGGTGGFTNASGTLKVVNGSGNVSWITLRFHV